MLKASSNRILCISMVSHSDTSPARQGLTSMTFTLNAYLKGIELLVSIDRDCQAEFGDTRNYSFSCILLYLYSHEK